MVSGLFLFLFFAKSGAGTPEKSFPVLFAAFRVGAKGKGKISGGGHTNSPLPLRQIPLKRFFMKLSGHWFCDRCDDVVHLPASIESPAKCPVCHNRTAVWISYQPKPVSDEIARQWFARIRETIAAAP